MKVQKAIIPAAGLGTRVLPASKSIPKEMLHIVDRPAIQYIVEEAVSSGITEIMIIQIIMKTIIKDTPTGIPTKIPYFNFSEHPFCLSFNSNPSEHCIHLELLADKQF